MTAFALSHPGCGTPLFDRRRLGSPRNIKATRDGNIVMAESGVNKIALVEVGK
jgi:hypothetical protein